MKLKHFLEHVREYCENCTLAGLSYIANNRLHFTERIFWLACCALSTVGVYYLIIEYEEHFEQRSVGIVYESLPPFDKVYFPTVSVCLIKERNRGNEKLEAYVQEVSPKEEYEIDIEEFLTQLLFPYDYIAPKFKSCIDRKTKAIICPDVNYRDVIGKFQPNCSEFFFSCMLSGRRFDCCRFFIPLTSPFGICFMMNSFMNNKIGSKRWFPSAIDRSIGYFQMDIVTNMAMRMTFLNEEDIAYVNLPSINTQVFRPGHKEYQLYMEDMVNDPDVRELSIESRSCRFPDETLPDTGFKVYSFSTCYMDCIRHYQMKYCNCTLFSYLPKPVAKYPDCNLNGLLCLEKEMLFKPDARMFVPWSQTFPCECLPSCDEIEMQNIYESAIMRPNTPGTYSLSIKMPDLPTHRYRRQALRTHLDVVVTVGGILGLFMGASVLSLMEFFYYFTVRIYNNWRMRQQ